MNYHRTWIEINPDVFNHNVSQYKKVIGNNNLAIIVKANAYGHGMYEIAYLAQHNQHINMICVATTTEAFILYHSGIQKPLLILSPVFDTDPYQLLHTNIRCTLSDFKTALWLNNIGKKNNYHFPIHLKIDTGLSRFGIDYAQAEKLINKILLLPNLLVEGIFSHFAESHKIDQSFTLLQINRFVSLVEKLSANNVFFKYIHISNSAATTSLDIPFCNLFRIGIGIYGLWPSIHIQTLTKLKYPFFDITPIATWKTKIMHIKKIKKGTFIGYDCTVQALHPMVLAMLPIGYYDGYDSRLFNKAFVRIANQYAPIVGRISMNTCTVDITHIPNITIGQEVILMGPYPHIHPEHLGVSIGNVNVREITTKIKNDIPKVFVPKIAFQPDGQMKKRYAKQKLL